MTCQGSWVGAAALHVKVGWHCTIAVSALCSVHQLPRCECAVKRSCTPLGHLNTAYMSIYSRIKPYIRALKCIYKLKTHICIIMHLSAYLFVLICSNIHICIHVRIFSKPSMRIDYHYIYVYSITNNCTLSVQPNLPYI